MWQSGSFIRKLSISREWEVIDLVSHRCDAYLQANSMAFGLGSTLAIRHIYTFQRAADIRLHLDLHPCSPEPLGEFVKCSQGSRPPA